MTRLSLSPCPLFENRITRADRGWLLAFLGVILIFSGACATARAPRSIMLETAQEEIPQEQLVDIVVAPFATGVPEEPADRDDDVFPEVRKAEARFFATHLKNTLESTGNWGAVTVAPASDDIGLKIEGEILESNGESLALHVSANDSTGRSWIDREYRSQLPVSAYLPVPGEQREPFQDLYNRIANDLVKAWNELSPADRVEVNQVAELRFAESLAADAFGGRLETDRKGRTEILRLPAEDDSMLAHVRAIRDRDRALRETLDEGYTDFYDELIEPYHRWRSFTAEEVVALRKIEREGYMKAGLGILAIVGGVMLSVVDGGLTSELLVAPMIAGGFFAASKGLEQIGERSIHVGAIAELGNSFDADVAPRVVEIQGETVRITGNAEAQYREWRRLLRAIYEAETGLPVTEGG